MSDGFLSPTSPETLPAIETAPQEEPSAVELDEQALEQIEAAEKVDEFLEEPEAPAAAPAVEGEKPAEAPAVEAPKDELLEAVEKILEKELGVYDQHFVPEVKARFEDKGKEVARELTAKIRKNSAKPRFIHHAIRKWLLTVPRVNKQFVEQTAKIKTDQLLQLAKDQREKQNKIP